MKTNVDYSVCLETRHLMKYVDSSGCALSFDFSADLAQHAVCLSTSNGCFDQPHQGIELSVEDRQKIAYRIASQLAEEGWFKVEVHLAGDAFLFNRPDSDFPIL